MAWDENDSPERKKNSMSKTEHGECVATGKMLNESENVVCNVTTTEKIVGIYGLFCRTTCKWYIGQSTDVMDRWDKYRRLKCKSQRKLYRAILKYGFDSFDSKIIERCDDVPWILDYREMYWIRRIDSIKSGYNIREGGQGGSHSPETIEKMRMSALKRKPRTFGEVARRNIANALRGRKHSTETKEKIRNAHLGMTLSADHRKKISNTLLLRRKISTLSVSPSDSEKPDYDLSTMP